MVNLASIGGGGCDIGELSGNESNGKYSRVNDGKTTCAELLPFIKTKHRIANNAQRKTDNLDARIYKDEYIIQIDIA